MKSIILSFVAATALLASSVSAQQCGQGQGPKNGVCEDCEPGYYNDQSAGECKAAQPGWYACNSQSLTCRGAKEQTKCGKGYYSTGYGNAGCTECPAGSICQSETTDQPLACVPGRYMPDKRSGASQCLECPPGKYNNEYGATACCNCCAGTFNDKYSQTHCFYCGEHTNPQVYNSPVGATSVNQCQAAPVDGVTRAPKGTCDVTPAEGTHAGSGDCPAEQGTSPTGTIPQRRHLGCRPGFKSCPLYSGIGGFDCVDVKNDPEQCGGCVSIDGLPIPSSGPEGQDCTAIPNVSVVNCVRGKCIIENCRKGFTKSKDGKSCTTAGNLRVQEQKDAAKRSTQGRRWHVSHMEN